MALKRRTWNNIIIIACILMVSVLTLLDKQMNGMPDDAAPLFDDTTPLTSLQLDGLSLERTDGRFVCDEGISNCDAWGKAWLGLKVSPLSEAPLATSDPRELVIRIGEREPQAWLLFDEGILKSPQGRWYLVPPSLRAAIEPKLTSSH
ncbi:hypothetical protein KJI95_16670 [Shewanella sp. JM162201]|uniref:Uncharacterized protein n=1 Tax=Shewanella jiangmenensis TaxID=2837387 RepID=A0ABS5V8F1_9GAMM|nr:hypothetical protein [Shewanella jiangmenensis]MBT1446132.1 hypothetical protein [Shewanella jiangmenensis]